VENPVAVLDQEEAKKFLMGKPSDKYNFFCKATELERIDRHYASTQDSLADMNESQNGVLKTLRPQEELTAKLNAEWQECQALEKLEIKVTDAKVRLLWCLHRIIKEEETKELDKLDAFCEKFEKLETRIAEYKKKAKEGEDADAQAEKEASVTKLSDEAQVRPPQTATHVV